jgi:enoyl-CoA hydratase
MKTENIYVEIQEVIATVFINRPKSLNALNADTISELNIAFQELDSNREVRAILLTGSGDKAFVAGADIKEFSSFDSEKGKELAALGQEKLFDFVENLSTPVIALVNGFALGGGLELAMSAHIRIAAESAKMGLPEVTLGLIPGYGGTQRLAQLIGKGRALELILSAQMINAERAYEIGLVNHVVSSEELMAFGLKLASKIVRNSSTAISNAIQAVNAGFNREGFKAEIDAFGSCFDTPDFKEGTEAFMEKRKPNFN